jgi:hypothetical protein
VVLLLLALAGLYTGYSGALMAGSFKMASPWPPPPGHEAYYDRLAARYSNLALGSLSLLVGALVMLWRRRHRAARAEIAS